MNTDEHQFEYIVIGAGAGGGPLAANLAKAGRSVLLLDAGGDYKDANHSVTNANYEVAGFNAKVAEDPNLRWDFFIEHYKRPEQPDSKYVPGRGILYPRAVTLGG